jgi:hypothetical protein
MAEAGRQALRFGLSPPGLQHLALQIERAPDEIVGLVEPFHALGSVRSRDDHLESGSRAFAADLAPHLLPLSFKDPKH